MVTRSHQLALARERQRRFKLRRRQGLMVTNVEVDGPILGLLIDHAKWLHEADAD
jgi:hypothetical protein